MSITPAVALHDVTKTFPVKEARVEAVRRVDLTIAPGRGRRLFWLVFVIAAWSFRRDTARV